MSIDPDALAALERLEERERQRYVQPPQPGAPASPAQRQHGEAAAFLDQVQNAKAKKNGQTVENFWRRS